MTETILALIPSYGLWVIFLTLLLCALAVPLPGSMLMIAAGSFASTGDIDLYLAMTVAYAGFIAGDQTAYGIAHALGPRLMDRFRKSNKVAPMVGRAERLLDRRGVLAVFLSHTIVSPVGPWVNYLCGAARMKWVHFSAASVVGAACWVAAYGLVGYYFADRLAELAQLANDGMGFIAAFAVAAGAGWWLWASWRRYRERIVAEETAEGRPLQEMEEKGQKI
ncbi:membrane protein DedA, SNARE-associated domain [Cohaesibacter marisflavi]|uniref:Membrane protein DedA, SNARE-associated domain n=1 Tax=Cohaesibacter marisflavi TaxID=655353 RepID=A0A1I5DCI6_9HYPH|nr:DedA family protein [Cohaesibacter marisflavi]SFN96846.1 membrane protein DedA, SNARE-associated domain [Cohaesibacter marisflavi]